MMGFLTGTIYHSFIKKLPEKLKSEDDAYWQLLADAMKKLEFNLSGIIGVLNWDEKKGMLCSQGHISEKGCEVLSCHPLLQLEVASILLKQGVMGFSAKPIKDTDCLYEEGDRPQIKRLYHPEDKGIWVDYDKRNIAINCMGEKRKFSYQSGLNDLVWHPGGDFLIVSIADLFRKYDRCVGFSQAKKLKAIFLKLVVWHLIFQVGI